MPLTEKGKKLRDKFRGHYGNKKGDSVFYAMENSGKLRKVLKARGGKDASEDSFKTPSSGTYSRSYNPGAGGVVQHGGTKNVGSGVGSNENKKSNFRFNKDQVVSTVLNIAAFPLGTAYKFIKERKPKKKHPFSANTKKQTLPKPTIMGGDENVRKLCPDGSMPPCKPVNTSATSPTKPNFLDNFQSYNSGGVSSGPPPKRGPNPQVPPIKMRSGKMTKTYKMSCPHRPDGIRGMGAALKGHKFIGVK